MSRTIGDAGMTSDRRVLLIDDGEMERAFVADRLVKAGYTVSTARDGAEGMRSLYELRPDLVLLDIVMPQMDGWKTLELIRAVSDVPVIMLTARDSHLERVRGLKSGADDYIGKPFDPAELTARVDAVLRRAAEKPGVKEIWDDGVVRIDYGSSSVTVRGKHVPLTPLEFRLLAVLTENAGQVLSRSQLLELVWGGTAGRSVDAVKLYVGYVRRKIETDTAQPALIETVRGFGYRYIKP
jgi:two-component system KDP operon response regulator KdpE